MGTDRLIEERNAAERVEPGTTYVHTSHGYKQIMMRKRGGGINFGYRDERQFEEEEEDRQAGRQQQQEPGRLSFVKEEIG
jgi:hypothetical protein